MNNVNLNFQPVLNVLLFFKTQNLSIKMIKLNKKGKKMLEVYFNFKPISAFFFNKFK